MSTLLLEIGAEEIPARFLPKAMEDLKRLTQEGMAGHSIKVSAENIKAYATPRRLVVTVRDIPERQEDRVKEVFGPPKKVAFNPDGTLSRAGEKFLAGYNLKPERLVIKKKDKGEYVAAEVMEKGLPTKEVLPDVLKKIILSLSFPKSMRWGDGTLRFVRPIRWLVAMLDSEVIPLEIDGIRSGNETRGHRFLSPGPVRLDHADSYESILERNFVILDPKKREDIINIQVKELTGSDVMDEELLATVTCLVEYPYSVMGEFDEKYLALPNELLTTVMKSHQKYFPVRDNRNNLTNRFIVVSNTREENADVVRTGAERVIRARLEDARFYFNEDRKKKLKDRVEDLKRVTYHEKLGSLYDKTMRIKALCLFIGEKVINAEKEKNLAALKRAAMLSKCDLVTGVVREFPELQGVMGMYYALGDNEDDVPFAISAVQLAIRDQYHPVYYGDYIPGNDTGAILSLADKMDNIASFFSIGLKPTGSEDPFALRRASLGVIRILLDKGYKISIKEVLEKAVSSLPHIKEPEPLIREIAEFFEIRIENHLLTFYGKEYSPDVIQAVIHLSTIIPLIDALGRMDALMGFKSAPKYGDFLLAVKRVRNIIPKREMPSPKPELFKEEEEKKLFEVLEKVKDSADDFIEDALYKDALEVFLGLTQPINDFFDKVLVMDKDERVRENRLALLASVWETVSTFADFSRLL